MEREFCYVMELNEDYILLKNVRNEIYQIDGSYNDGYEEEEQVILSYLEREKIGESMYKICPESLFRFSDKAEVLK